MSVLCRLIVKGINEWNLVDSAARLCNKESSGYS